MGTTLQANEIQPHPKTNWTALSLMITTNVIYLPQKGQKRSPVEKNLCFDFFTEISRPSYYELQESSYKKYLLEDIHILKYCTVMVKE